jgi:hypothetical protein
LGFIPPILGDKNMATRMQQRRGTAEQWTLANPILAPGEIGFETDTNQFKIGDGVNQWEDIEYFLNSGEVDEILGDYIPLSEKGEANGVATLDEEGQVPAAQLANATVDLSEYATEEYVDTAVSNLVDSAPEALDTLNELAAALGDDANFATTVTNSIATKAPIESPTFTGTVSGVTKTHVGLGNVDNTSDADKPVSTDQQTALNGKANTSHTHTITDITTFAVTSPANGQALVYNSATDKWENAAVSGESFSPLLLMGA